MDQRLKTALEYADYVTTFKNQKRVLQETYNKDWCKDFCKSVTNGNEMF